ncbi:hypothetical protein CC85DRAFT_17764 [Cutaneotrichosporon oleaginosum]|uniref:Granulins domain-containing protein n=1 Tax=Cutaneotrichosporon oleaginosum TaxID=879819 RepID=A0A0J0XTL7_9TREE|nr:uncharacterized protein CC85DRAFT_17764 [Cutaneotrichosporon oleaginosum]KLT44421.1 hypothetical protein CC85DRAFT_17764 [Cutaneotrichosporon oleaginosum]TXT07859.1 hypothetical protein COLE_04783 [Cutaneotrichosporon oleaginosum]
MHLPHILVVLTLLGHVAALGIKFNVTLAGYHFEGTLAIGLGIPDSVWKEDPAPLGNNSTDLSSGDPTDASEPYGRVSPPAIDAPLAQISSSLEVRDASPDDHIPPHWNHIDICRRGVYRLDQKRTPPAPRPDKRRLPSRRYLRLAERDSDNTLHASPSPARSPERPPSPNSKRPWLMENAQAQNEGTGGGGPIRNEARNTEGVHVLEQQREVLPRRAANGNSHTSENEGPGFETTADLGVAQAEVEVQEDIEIEFAVAGITIVEIDIGDDDAGREDGAPNVEVGRQLAPLARGLELTAALPFLGTRVEIEVDEDADVEIESPFADIEVEVEDDDEVEVEVESGPANAEIEIEDDEDTDDEDDDADDDDDDDDGEDGDDEDGHDEQDEDKDESEPTHPERRLAWSKRAADGQEPGADGHSDSYSAYDYDESTSGYSVPDVNYAGYTTDNVLANKRNADHSRSLLKRSTSDRAVGGGTKDTDGSPDPPHSHTARPGAEFGTVATSDGGSPTSDISTGCNEGEIRCTRFGSCLPKTVKCCKHGKTYCPESFYCINNGQSCCRVGKWCPLYVTGTIKRGSLDLVNVVKAGDSRLGDWAFLVAMDFNL